MGVLRCPRTVDHPLPSLPESCSHCWELPGFALVHRAARDPCHLLSATPPHLQPQLSHAAHSLQWCLVGPQVVPPSELLLSPRAAPPQGQSSWASTLLPHPCRGPGPSPPLSQGTAPFPLGAPRSVGSVGTPCVQSVSLPIREPLPGVHLGASVRPALPDCPAFRCPWGLRRSKPPAAAATVEPPPPPSVCTAGRD